MRILVSACLLGLNCRYDGAGKRNENVLCLAEKHELIPFCPEIYGGLTTPRDPAEIRDGRVITRSGRDVTDEYRRGAEEALKLFELLQCDCALLQDRSPSCGCGTIHNGRFDGGLIAGNGVAAEFMCRHGIRVIPSSAANRFL